MRLVWARRTAALAAAAALAITGIDGTAAQTPPPPEPCPAADSNPTGPTVVIDSPVEGAVAKTPGEATVLGNARSSSGGAIERVLLTLTRIVDGQPQEVGREVFLLDPPGPDYAISWLPPLPYNDAYVLCAQAVGTNRFGQRFAGPPSTRRFNTEIPPARPSNLKIATDQEKRTATLTWTKNPEPDVVGYIVRRAPGEGDFADVGSPVEPTYTDDLAAANPGAYRYRVVAVRRKSPTAPDGVESTAPAESRVTITGAPTATTTSAPPTTRPRTTATTARPRNRAAANRVDLRRFGSPTSTIPDGSLEPEEGAFGDLDFGTRQPGRTDMTITELGQPVTEDGDERPTTLLFFAGGLLAFVVLMQLRWLKNEVDRVPLEEVPPEN